MYRFAGELEQIADNLKRIAMDVHKEKKPLNKHVLVAFEHYVALVESLFEVFHKSDSDTITSLRDKRNEVRDEILSTFARKGLRSVDCVVLTWLFGILTCIKNIETEMYHV
jgi:Na+/phosphate symporter